MEKRFPSVSENEWFIMKVLWNSSRPCTSTEIIEQLKGIKDVSKRTIRVMIGRLVKKGAVDFAVDKNNAALYHYFPLVSEEECLRNKSRQFQEAYFKDDTNLMFATMIQNTPLSKENVDELIAMLEQLKTK